MTEAKKQCAGAADTPLMTQIGGGGGRGDLDGRLILLNWPVQSYGAMGKITTGGTNPTSHTKAAEMAKQSPAHRPQGLGFDHRHRLPTINS